MKPTRLFVTALCLSLGFVACECEQRTNQRFGKAEFLDADGNERTLVDFGQVQVNVIGEQKVRVRNGGAAPLALNGATFSKDLFGAATALPLTLGVSEEVEFKLTFTPVDVDLVVEGTVDISTDDPQRETVRLTLKGRGITAVAVPTPRILDFQDVYVGESKALAVTVTNAGSNDLTITDARLTAAVPAEVTGDLTALEKTVLAGQSVTTTFTFAPTVMADAFAGALELELAGGLGVLTVPVRGRAAQAKPRLCFKYDNSPLEQCTDDLVTFLPVAFGSLCDNRLYPDDGGVSPCVGVDGGAVAHRQGARVYFRNEGNTPVAYSLRYESRVGGTCDGGSDVDFQFANAPAGADGGPQLTWSEATVSLPAQASDPRPWETAPVALAYRPSSNCRQDAADQARVLWTRQGEPAGTNRAPSSLILNLVGQSLLPKGVAQDITCTGTIPCAVNFIGIGNAGDAPLAVTGVTLWQADYIPLPDGGIGRGNVPFEQCVGGSSGDCAVFSWASGTGPVLPVTLAGTSNAGMPTTRVLGSIVFGKLDAGTLPLQNREYRIFGVIQTDDPYDPQVISNIRATYR